MCTDTVCQYVGEYMYRYCVSILCVNTRAVYIYVQILCVNTVCQD